MQAADRAMIQDLVSRYGFFADYGPDSAWVDLFAPDARWSVAGTGILVQGRDELLKLVAIIREHASGLHHAQSNQVIDLDGDRATGKVALNQFLLRPEQIYSVGHGWYDDVYTRIDGRWYFEQRTAQLSPDAMQVSTGGKIGEYMMPMLGRFAAQFGKG